MLLKPIPLVAESCMSIEHNTEELLCQFALVKKYVIFSLVDPASFNAWTVKKLNFEIITSTFTGIIPEGN